MVWQPMPPPATEPSGSFVEVLCGQPLQKCGPRAGEASPAARSVAVSRELQLFLSHRAKNKEE